MNFVDFLNAACGLVLMISGTCKLGGHNYGVRNPKLWAHSSLAVGGLGWFLSPIVNMGLFETVLPVLGVLIYFAEQSIRTWKLQSRFALMREIAARETTALPQSKPHIKLKRKK